MDDKTIRRKAQERGWWYAAARMDGPAHIMNGTYSLCGADGYSRFPVKANRLCLKCKAAAEKYFKWSASNDDSK